MAGSVRGILFGSMGVTGLLLLAALVDLITGMPFGGSMLLDIMMILAGGLVMYMAIDCLKDQK
ncbi:MAG: hypothetical protein KDA96_23000 [Planctomycetaceae bacterium]|nr:hypothetical protein [Planctomycetaceae bacterium]